MNTSFNLRPIVCTPKDAIRAFYSSGLDFLVMGDFVIAKDRAWEPLTLDGEKRHPRSPMWETFIFRNVIARAITASSQP